MDTPKPQSTSRHAAQKTSLAALLRPKSFDKLQRANELRKVGPIPDDSEDRIPMPGE